MLESNLSAAAGERGRSEQGLVLCSAPCHTSTLFWKAINSFVALRQTLAAQRNTPAQPIKTLISCRNLSQSAWHIPDVVICPETFIEICF